MMMKPRAPLPADERRAVTVEALVELAATHNPSEITTAAIAKHMNLSHGALFRHFPTKEDLWRAAMEWVAKRLLSRIDRATSEIDSPLAALEATFLAHAEFAADHPGAPRMMFGELQRAAPSPARHVAQALLKHYGERLGRVIEEGKAMGELAPDLDTEAAVLLFIGSIQGLVMQSALTGDMSSLRRHAPRAFAIYRRGIGAAK